MARKDSFNNKDALTNVTMQRFRNQDIEKDAKEVTENIIPTKSNASAVAAQLKAKKNMSQQEEKPAEATKTEEVEVKPVETAEVKEPEVQTAEVKDKPKKASKKASLVFDLERKETYPRTFVAWPDINDALDDLFRTKKGRLKPGSKGEMSKLLNNAILTELVRVGYFPEEKLNDREEYGSN